MRGATLMDAFMKQQTSLSAAAAGSSPSSVHQRKSTVTDLDVALTQNVVSPRSSASAATLKRLSSSQKRRHSQAAPNTKRSDSVPNSSRKDETSSAMTPTLPRSSSAGRIDTGVSDDPPGIFPLCRILQPGDRIYDFLACTPHLYD